MPSSEPYFPLGGDGWSNDKTATATCFCGAVQIEFAVDKVEATFVCNCSDCRKVTATMFASNFCVDDKNMKFVRGKDKISTWSTAKSVKTGNRMTNHFCSVCGGLMDRTSSGFEGKNFLRIGTVDDFNLHETVLKPKIEQFIPGRVSWLKGLDNVEQHEFMFGT